MNKYTYKEHFEQTVSVDPAGYDCFVTDSFDAFSKAVSAFAPEGRKVFLINERQYGGFYLERLSEAVSEAGCEITVFELSEEEEGFSLDTEAIYETFCAEGFGEEDFLLSLGGIRSDAAARLFALRYAPKIRYIKIPVTFVSQLLSASPLDAQLDLNRKAVWEAYKAATGEEAEESDSSGERSLPAKLTGRNPDLVYINILAYKNLSETDRISGLGEVLRIGAGYDKALFDYVENVTGKRADYLFTFLMNVILNCLQFGKEQTWEDRSGAPRLLFGDEIGMALEKCTNYIIPHGQAAVTGLIVASNLSNRRELLPNADHFSLAKVFASHGFVILMNFANELIDAICANLPNAAKEDPKETILLPKQIGTCISAADVTPDEIRRAMNYRR